jgi:hypothetical protein
MNTTTYDEISAEKFNDLPLGYWYYQFEYNTIGSIIPEINNGKITGAIQKHRQHVAIADGRNSYK